jgi:hypothetical protein
MHSPRTPEQIQNRPLTVADGEDTIPEVLLKLLPLYTEERIWRPVIR